MFTQFACEPDWCRVMDEVQHLRDVNTYLTVAVVILSLALVSALAQIAYIQLKESNKKGKV